MVNASSQKGKLIVIEGTDGSGKQTQARLLMERLQKEGHAVIASSFPQYGKKSAGLVEEYLNGKYGKSDEVNPYVASLFYALDRFDASVTIRQFLQTEHIVVLDRYVDSNAGHQGGKIADEKKREQFLAWLYEIEYAVLEIPKPDIVVILHVPAEIGQQLVDKKQARLYLEKGTRDSHEADIQHLQHAEASYLLLAKRFPDDHVVIECVENGQLLPPEVIHQTLWTTLQEKVLR